MPTLCNINGMGKVLHLGLDQKGMTEQDNTIQKSNQAYISYFRIKEQCLCNKSNLKHPPLDQNEILMS